MWPLADKSSGPGSAAKKPGDLGGRAVPSVPVSPAAVRAMPASIIRSMNAQEASGELLPHEHASAPGALRTASPHLGLLI